VIQQTLKETIQGGLLVKDKVVAILYLGDIQVVTIALLFLSRREESQPILKATMQRLQHVLRAKGISQFLQTLGIGTIEESVFALVVGDPFAVHLPSEPLVTVETDFSDKREVRTQAQKQPPTLGILAIEVIQVDKAPG
jgi:hypothetical protein